MKSILDQSFNYVPPHKTDISVTFERVRQEIREREAAERQQRERAVDHVARFQPRRKQA